MLAMIALGASSACTSSVRGSPSSPITTSVATSPSNPTRSTSDGDEQSLYAHRWVLSDIAVPAGLRRVSTTTAAAFALTFERDKSTVGGIGVMDGDCDNATLTVTATRITFIQPWVNDLVLRDGCANDPRDPNAREIFTILSGTVTWLISDGKLTIVKGGTGTLTYIASN